jgi:two-component system, chemotaxis family, sensor kinase CheA
MADDVAKLVEAVDQLALQVVMIEPGDLMALGSILRDIESIEKTCLDSGLKPIGTLSGAVRKLVEKVILNDLKDAQKGFDLMGSGIELIQKHLSTPDQAQSHDAEKSFWTEMESLEGIAKPDGFEETSATEQASKETIDFTQDGQVYSDFISEAMEHLEAIELHIVSLEQSPHDKEHINTVFRAFHTIKGVSGFLNLQKINKFSHAVETLLDEARNEKLAITNETIDFILEAVDLLKNMICDLKGPDRPDPSRFDIEPHLARMKRLREGEGLDSSEAGKQPLGETASTKGIVSEASPKRVIDTLREQKKGEPSLSGATVKVDIQKLDNLIDMVGELVIAQSLVQQNPVFLTINDQKLSRDVAHLKRITTELQKTSMSLRMISVRQTFQKMVRVVRDLCSKSGKKADLVLSGEDTEIDRGMVDALYDPLVHMMRNAVDHGIEESEKRKEHGKAETGRIDLRAYQKGGHIIIEIEDDGQGLDRARILQKARQKGLISSDNGLNEHQIDNLIFEPGFSTADKVTDVSGRGVGMDVVKQAFEKLKGKVEIFSTVGTGCRFVMLVPLTLAIVDGIQVRVGEEHYIIPAVFIKETLRPAREDIVQIHNKEEVVKVRNSLLPIVRLHNLFRVIPQKKDPWDALIVVAECNGQQKGLMIDDLIGKQEVVIKNLGETLEGVKGLSGATILGDGRVGLILDVHGVFEIAAAA